MKNLSVSKISKTYGISKDTLRYYDKIGLVSPKRGENRYRYYREEDLLDLQYIEVMKYAGFSLKEIKKILENKGGCTEENRTDTLLLLENKQKQIKRKIEVYQCILSLMSEAGEVLKNKELYTESTEMNTFIKSIYQKTKENDYEE